jgi:hypothetical protein
VRQSDRYGAAGQFGDFGECREPFADISGAAAGSADWAPKAASLPRPIAETVHGPKVPLRSFFRAVPSINHLFQLISHFVHLIQC